MTLVTRSMRIVAQDSGRLARGIANDCPAVRIGRVAVDPRELQRQAVQEQVVPIGAADRDRRVGSDRVDPRVVGKLAAPALLVPAQAFEPPSGRQRGRAFGQRVDRVAGGS